MARESDAPRTTIEGSVERITFVNRDSRYVVARIQEPGRKDLTTAVGKLWPISEGENLRLRGRWVTHKKFGDQFEADHCEATAPSSLEGIERYLGSGMIKGLGPVTAKRLVQAFGERTLDVITHEPQRLAEVPGIGRKRRKQIIDGWQDQQGVREVMVFLQGHGVNPAHAARIYKLYGEQAIHIVNRDPYRLVTDVYGIGFKTADGIAAKLGVARDAPERRRAGLCYVLGLAAEDGHTHLPERVLLDRTRDLLGQDGREPRAELDALVREQRIVREGEPQERRCYLPEHHAGEVHVCQALDALRHGRSRLPEIKVEIAIEWFEERKSITLTGAQRDCVRRVASDKVLAITGGPGTGKTTILRALCEIYKAKGMEVVLAAPTGRAANRMSDVTGLPARTLHRLLDFSPREARFLRGPDHPLIGDLFIIDEVSMVDLPLAAALLEALPPHAALVLVGDAEQLPSVGPGQVLRDLLASGRVPVIRLTEIMRQQADSAIVAHAHAIQQGKLPRVQPIADAVGGNAADCLWVHAEEPEQVLDVVKRLHARYIPERLGCDAVNDIQVLTPMNRHKLGVDVLNAELQQLLNPAGDELVRGAHALRVGDKVIQQRNNYDKGVFNGDLGRVSRVRADAREVTVLFDAGAIVYEGAELDELKLAYAVTVHKAQGSEYPAVILLVHPQHAYMLERNLLYTGLTRGKQLVVLVGTDDAFRLAIQTRRAHRRYTTLAARLNGSLEGMVEPVEVNQLHLAGV